MLASLGALPLSVLRVHSPIGGQAPLLKSREMAQLPPTVGCGPTASHGSRGAAKGGGGREGGTRAGGPSQQPGRGAARSGAALLGTAGRPRHGAARSRLARRARAGRFLLSTHEVWPDTGAVTQRPSKEEKDREFGRKGR